MKHISIHIAVICLGMVETADAETLLREPRHLYTRALISAIPEPGPDASREHQVNRTAITWRLAPALRKLAV